MQRSRELDGIRGIAVLMVLVWHYVVCQILGAPAGSGLASLRDSLWLTWSGVDLFFVLSGFLIAGILLDHRGASNYFRAFYIRRACRILPLYYLLIGIHILLRILPFQAQQTEWLLREPMPLWSYAVFVQNIFMGMSGDFGAPSLGITWSLAVEEQFYLLIPLLIHLVRPKWAGAIMLTAVAAAPVLRICWPGFHSFVNMPWRADSLLSGACLAVLVRKPGFLEWVRRNPRWILGMLGLFAGVAVWMTIRPAWAGELRYLWLAGLYSTCVLVGFALTESRVAAVFRSPILVWFGVRSYGIYLFHQTISGLLHGLVRGAPPDIRTPEGLAVTSGALIATIIIAATSYRFLELPIIRFGHRSEYHPSHVKS
ncbi:MAG: acyltransferase [Chthoniobacteraceae bacterium]